MKNRIIGIILAIVMLLSVSATVFAETSVFESVPEEESTPAQQELERRAGERYGYSDEVELIVELDTEYFRDFGRSFTVEELRTSENSALQSAFAKRVIEAALRELKEEGIDFRMKAPLDLVFVGFTGKTSYGDALRMANLPMIRKIELSEEIQAPVEEVMASRGMWARGMIGAEDLPPEYDGRGMVAVIIGTDIDGTHPAFYLSEEGRAHKRLKFTDHTGLERFCREKGIEVHGQFVSEKMPFRYNYARKNTDVMEDRVSAQFSAGIIAGNRHVTRYGDEFTGIAPEAQIINLGLFSQQSGSDTSTLLIALNDALKFDPDVIDLDVFYEIPTESEEGEQSELFRKVIDRISGTGCVIVMPTSDADHIGGNNHLPKADSPDYGMAYERTGAMVAGSLKNRYKLAQGVLSIYREGKKVAGYEYKVQSDKTVFNPQTFYEYVDVGTAESEETVPDVSGKVALMEGGNKEKAKILFSKGAIGIVDYPTEEDKYFYAYRYSDFKEIPVIRIRRKDGLRLKKMTDATLSLQPEGFYERQEPIEIDPYGRGVTPSCDLAPDVLTPGSGIYTTSFKNEYEFGNRMQGSFLSGSMLQVRTRVQREFPTLSGEEKFKLQKQLVMSTAQLFVDPNTKKLASPRQQGAGRVSLREALTTKAVLYDSSTGESKVNLRNVEDRFQFTLHLKNLSDDTLTYRVRTHVMTDSVKKDRITLVPDPIAELDGGTVTVGPRDEVPITVTVDASSERDRLIGLMENGYFLEGFTILASEDDETELSVPFVGFRGKWEDLPCIDPFTKDLYPNGKKPMFGDRLTPYFVKFTEFLSDASEVVGRDPKSSFPNYRFYEGVLSPNNDARLDQMTFQATLLRHVKHLSARVFELDGEGNKIDEGVLLSEEKNIKKNCGANHRSTGYVFPKIRFPIDGSDRPKDGKYLIEIYATPAAKGAAVQTYFFPFSVDTKEPLVWNPKLENGYLTFEWRDDSELLEEEVYYWNEGEKILIPKTEHGYLLPTEVDRKRLRVFLRDRGKNKFEKTVEDLLVHVNVGKILFDVKTVPDTLPAPRFKMRVVTNDAAETPVDPKKAPVGEYKIFLDECSPDYRLITPTPIIVRLTDFDLEEVVPLEFEAIATARVKYWVDLNGHNEDFTVFVHNETTGINYEMRKHEHWSWMKMLEVRVPIGKNTLRIKGIDPTHRAVFDPEVVEASADAYYEGRLTIVPNRDFIVNVRTEPNHLTPTYRVYDHRTGEDSLFEGKKWEIGRYYVYPEETDGYYSTPPFRELTLDVNSTETTLDFRFESDEGTGSIEIRDNASEEGITPQYIAYDFRKRYDLPNGKVYEDLTALKPGHYYVTPKPGSYGENYRPEEKFREVSVKRGERVPAEFRWERTAGEIRVKAVDETNEEIPGVVFEVSMDGMVQTDWTSLPFGYYQVKIKEYDRTAYTLYGNEVQNVILLPLDPVAEVVFHLRRAGTPEPKGSLTLKVVDESGSDILDANTEILVKRDGEVITNLTDLSMGEYEVELTSYDRKKYELLSHTVQIVSLMPHQPNVTVKFILKKRGPTGWLIMKVVDESGNEILDANPMYRVSKDGEPIWYPEEGLEFGTYEVRLDSFSIRNFDLVGERTKVVTLTQEHPEATVTFTLRRKGTPPPPVKGSLHITVEDESGTAISDANPVYEVKKSGIVITKYTELELGEYEVRLKGFDEEKYEAVGMRTKTVNLTKEKPNAEVKFTLKRLPPPVKHYIIDAVEQLPKMNVRFGTKRETLSLSTHVKAEMHREGETQRIQREVAVEWKWADSDYDGRREGVYRVEGILLPEENVSNPKGLTAVQEIQVRPQENKFILTYVEQPELMNVPFFTPKSALILPAKIRVRARNISADGEEIAFEMDVRWNKKRSNYDGRMPGEYEIPGELSTTEFVVENPRWLYAVQRVVVENRKPPTGERSVIQSVEDPKKIEVEFGTALRELRLPEYVAVQVKKAESSTETEPKVSTEYLPVTWDLREYYPFEAKLYRIYGTIVLTGTAIENPKNWKVVQLLEVKTLRPPDRTPPKRPIPPPKRPRPPMPPKPVIMRNETEMLFRVKRSFQRRETGKIGKESV